MAFVHVFPIGGKKHRISKGADCWCEPRIMDLGVDKEGLPARVFVHSKADLSPTSECIKVLEKFRSRKH